jgi:hypothetical protein
MLHITTTASQVPMDFKYERVKPIDTESKRVIELTPIRDMEHWAPGENEYVSPKDMLLQNPKYGQYGVQMSFAEPPEVYGGINFKFPFKKKSV